MYWEDEVKTTDAPRYPMDVGGGAGGETICQRPSLSETKLDSDTEYEEGAIWLTIVKLPNTWGGGGGSPTFCGRFTSVSILTPDDITRV